MVYQKEGSPELAAQHAAKLKDFKSAGSNIQEAVDQLEEKRKAEKDRRENPMVDFETLMQPEVKPEETMLKKRRPFIRVKSRRAQLFKMNLYASLVPAIVIDEDKATQKLDLNGLHQKSQKASAWNEEMAEVIDDFATRNRFMLGNIERKRDQYDVEYDMGKTKKVKKKKAPKVFNFDKQAKKIQKRGGSTDKKKYGSKKRQ